MKKKYQLIVLVSQFVISFCLFIYIILYLINSLRFFNYNLASFVKTFSYIIQLFCFSYLSLKIYQMNEPRRNNFSNIFLFALLSLSINLLIIIPNTINNFDIIFLSQIVIGKLNIFSLFSSALFLILCGINQNKRNLKNNNFEIFLILCISIFISYVSPLSSPTIQNSLTILELPILIKIIFISLILLSIFSFIPSYLQDKTTHNKLKTVSFILFVSSIGLLRYSINLNYLIEIFSLFLLLFSSIYLIINLKSYSI